MSAAGEKQMYADTKGTSFSNVAVRHTVGTVGLLESTILPSISIQYVSVRIGDATGANEYEAAVLLS